MEKPADREAVGCQGTNTRRKLADVALFVARTIFAVGSIAHGWIRADEINGTTVPGSLIVAIALLAIWMFAAARGVVPISEPSLDRLATGVYSVGSDCQFVRCRGSGLASDTSSPRVLIIRWEKADHLISLSITN